MAEVLSNFSTYTSVLHRRAPSQNCCMKALASLQASRLRATNHDTAQEGRSWEGSPILLEEEGAILRKLQVSKKLEGERWEVPMTG